MLLRISKIQTFESNSQRLRTFVLLLGVAQNIKDTNFWKQFTTYPPTKNYNSELLRISKIQTFESNSQLSERTIHFTVRCSEYQRYKLLKAIHNNFREPTARLDVAQNIKDTNFWKQFTTSNSIKFLQRKLLRISKIQTFESNSQHLLPCRLSIPCCSEYQRYKLLKAIHNFALFFPFGFIVAQNIKDTNFWKQFTTILSCLHYFFRCSEYQRYKLLKAIHNYVFVFRIYCLLLRISKIQTFESNSQLRLLLWLRLFRCSEYQRYKLLKAIHNMFLTSQI